MDKFTAFYRTYREKLFFYLVRMTGDYHLAGDIMQESFTRLLAHYGPDEKNASLLFTIARNAVMDEARRVRKNRELAPIFLDNPMDTERHLLVRQEYKKVLTGLQQLETMEREVLALVVSADFSYREIAEIVGMSEANVRVKVHRARVKLKKILQQEEEV